MARRSIGLWIVGLWVWQSGCSGDDRAPAVGASPRSDGGRDVGQEPETPDTVDAALDAAAGDRGEAPRWPVAEEELELPYQGPTVAHLLTVGATPGALDVHLNVDTTSSIRFAIDELQVALRGTVIERLRERVDDVAFGVSRFADFPVEPFGESGTSNPARTREDQPFVLLTPVTTNVDRVIRAVGRLDDPLDFGGDIKEAGAEALYQVATGAGYAVGSRRLIERGPTTAAIGGGTLGGVGFRDYALHVVLHVADSPTHTPAEYDEGGLVGTRSLRDAALALQELGARVVSIIPTGCETAECRQGSPYAPTRIELSELAMATAATRAADRGECPTGIAGARLPSYEDVCPLVFDARIDGTGVSRTLSDAVFALLEEVRFSEVHAEPGADHLGFIREVRAEPVEQASGVPAPERGDRLPEGAPDGAADSYLQVDRRNRLGFRVFLRNDRIAPRDVAQRFRVAIRVQGDSVLLEERYLRVVVPALRKGALDPESSGQVAPEAGAEDAGR